jgi:hypothetical protein
MPDINDIFLKEDITDNVLQYHGVEIKVKTKPVTWSRKNQILTKCFSYAQDGSMQFDFDKYMKEVLIETIISADWGKTDHIFLSRIKPDFGAMLEKLVPKAFEEMDSTNFFGKGSDRLSEEQKGA